MISEGTSSCDTGINKKYDFLLYFWSNKYSLYEKKSPLSKTFKNVTDPKLWKVVSHFRLHVLFTAAHRFSCIGGGQGHMALCVREDWFSGGKGRRRVGAGVCSDSLTNVDVSLGLPAVLQVVDKRVADLTLQGNSLTTRAQAQWVTNLCGFWTRPLHVPGW